MYVSCFPFGLVILFSLNPWKNLFTATHRLDFSSFCHNCLALHFFINSCTEIVICTTEQNTLKTRNKSKFFYEGKIIKGAKKYVLRSRGLIVHAFEKHTYKGMYGMCQTVGNSWLYISNTQFFFFVNRIRNVKIVIQTKFKTRSLTNWRCSGSKMETLT